MVLLVLEASVATEHSYRTGYGVALDAHHSVETAEIAVIGLSCAERSGLGVGSFDARTLILFVVGGNDLLAVDVLGAFDDLELFVGVFEISDSFGVSFVLALLLLRGGSRVVGLLYSGRR